MISHKRLVPASPSNLKSWIIEALQVGPLERNELLEAVDTIAQQKGYKVADVATLKKALVVMGKEQVVTNLRKGWWSLSSPALVPENFSPTSLLMGKRSVSVLREMGEGSEYVYVLQYRDDVKKATEAGNFEWSCKIGRSKNASQRLLSNVSSTYLNRLPEVGLMIKCENSITVEAALHNALRYCNRQVKESPGQEWFITSPDLVAKFYLGWLKMCSELTRMPIGEKVVAYNPPYANPLVQYYTR